MHRERDERIATAVMLTDRDLSDATRILAKLLESQTKPNMPGGSDSGEPDRFMLRRRAAEVLRLRLKRAIHFNPSMFGEPAWDMLLVLYVHEDSRFTISRLQQQARLSKSTALRWLEYLVDQGLLVRTGHPTDARTVRVELTEIARNALDRYFSEARRPAP